MFLHQIELTTALRPLLLPDESLLFVQDGVGLYEGKSKFSDYQNGQAYLTSYRACYIDNEEPRKFSVAVDLKDVDRYEFYAGFLKSSPKVTFVPKASKRASYLGTGAAASPRLDAARLNTPTRPLSPAPVVHINATWICPICSLSNPVPSGFDPSTANAHTPLPSCLACGIKPPLILLVKAAINAMARRQTGQSNGQTLRRQSLETAQLTTQDREFGDSAGRSARAEAVSCPRCTFQNHPSLLICEMCGASLVTLPNRVLNVAYQNLKRSESPAPSVQSLSQIDDVSDSIKFSFRAGGEKIFYERLRGAMVQRKWLLQSAPPVPKPNVVAHSFGNGLGLTSGGLSQNPQSDLQRPIGIAGLERRGFELRKNNEVVIGSAFEDLEALMTSAKEVIELAESFRSSANLGSNGNSTEANALLTESASALGLVTTKDMFGSSSEATYISELSRNLAEFLTDDVKGVLRKEGGIMSLVDLWAVFNRARGGVELVSPTDFGQATQMWDKLKLPVRLRRFKSGLLVVQSHDRTDEKTVASMLTWLKQLHYEQPVVDVTWDWRLFGRGVTVQETAERFGWSVGVASEELEMAEERGVLCREQGLEGVRFWENWLEHEPELHRVAPAELHKLRI